MNPRRWVHRCAGSLFLLSLVCLGTPAGAQVGETARTTVELPPDPIARSPRLLGMGMLTLLQDRDNRIDLWNFAGNPVGLYDVDSTSVFALRPTSSSSSDARDFSTSNGVGDLQTAATRNSRLQFDAVRRPGQGTTYGLLGELTELRSDALYSINSERRSLLSHPLGLPFIAGELPFLDRKRFRYAISGIFGIEDTKDEYRHLFVNDAGQYVDHDGTLIGPPEFFTPDDYFIRRLGGGLAISYRARPSLLAAISGRIVSNGIEGKNEGDRYASENRERRPVFSGQATLIGRVGRGFEWGADGQAWSSSSTTTWVFTISPQGGPGPTRPPLTGRGDLAKRKEDGQRLKVRGRLLAGVFELGGSLGTFYRKVEITPSPLSSPSSFNSFRQLIFLQPLTPDTLALPSDVLSSDNEERDWEAAGGISTPFRRHRGMIGTEFHYVKRHVNALTGQGAVAEEINHLPQIATEEKGVLWDARAGMEYRWTDVLLGRVGYIYRSQDLNELTEQNEYTSNSVTGGIGLHPPGVRWTFDAGYAFEWVQADFGAPDAPRATRQQLGVTLRWDF